MREIITKTILGLLCVFITITSFSQDWDWVTYGASTGVTLSTANDIEIDDQGNTYVSFQFQENIEIQGNLITSLDVSPTNDGLVVKFDPNGNVVWITQIGGIGSEVSTDLVLDGLGNVYVTGTWNTQIIIGGFTLSAPVNVDEIFLTKLDASTGTPAWLVEAGGDITPFGIGTSGIVTNSAGEIFVSGAFEGTQSFGSNSVTSVDGQDIFVAKYTGSGISSWVQSFGGQNHDVSMEIAIDGNNDLLITGYYRDDLTFSPTVLNSTGIGIYVAKLSGTNATPIWAKSATASSSINAGWSLRTDSNNDVIVVGGFHGTGTFGALTTSVPGGTQDDIFITKYNGSTGTEQWVLSAGGVGQDFVTDVFIDEFDNPYICGETRIGAQFGSTSIATVEGESDFYLAKVKQDGSDFCWINTDGSAWWDRANSIVVPQADVVYAVGGYQGPANFGTSTLPGTLFEQNSVIGKYVASDINITATPTILCPGQSSILDAGAGYTSYLWSTGETTQTITVTAAGTYSVSVNDGSGCSLHGEIQISTPVFPFINLGPDITECWAPLSGPILDPGAFSGVTYDWTFNGAPYASSVQSVLAFQTGEYCVIATTSEGCVLEDCINITLIDMDVVMAIPPGPYCVGSRLCFSGIPVIGPSGPPNSPTYTMDFGDGTIVAETVPTSECHSYDFPGTYTVTYTITTIEGCVFSTSYDVTINANPIVTILGPTFLCPGDIGTLSVITSAASPTYDWSTGSNSFSTTINLGGIYTVEVTDANGCSEIDEHSVTRPMSLVVTTEDPCPSTFDGYILVEVLGGTGSFTFSWADDPSETGDERDGLDIGTYTVTVVDANGCNLVQNITLNPGSLDFEYEISLCEGTQCDPHHEIEVTEVYGGVAPYDYDAGTANLSGNVLTFEPGDLGVGGTTTLTVMDNLGCTGTEVISLPDLYSVEGTPTVPGAGFTYSGGNWCMTVENAVSYELTIYDEICLPEPIFEEEEDFEIDDACDEANMSICFSSGEVGYDDCYATIGYYELILYDCDGNDWDFDGNIAGDQVGSCDCCCGPGMGAWCPDCFWGFICAPPDVPTQFYHEYETITSTTNWNNETHYVTGTLIVKSGEILNIKKSNVIFSEDAKIIVEPRAKLNIDKSTLEACDFVRWQGIEVQGDFYCGQNPSCQGRIDVKNSTIRDADIAIFSGTRDEDGAIDPDGGGGIVRIRNNSSLENNGTHVWLTPYDGEIEQTIIEDSKFNQTHLMDRLDGSNGHIYVEKSKGLTIENSTFEGGKKGITMISSSDFNIITNEFQ